LRKIIYIFILLYFLVLGSLIGFMLGSFVHNVNANTTDDLEFNFDSDYIYNENKPFSNSTFNLRDSYEYSQNYSATYSFKNELIDTEGTDISFIDVYNNNPNTYVKIKELINNHRKIIDFYDNNNSHYVDITNNIDNKPYGTIEFWLSSNNSNKDFTIIFRNLDVNIFGIGVENSVFRYLTYNWFTLEGSVNNNTWYHIRFDFECTEGGYKGLSQYRYYLYINSKEYGSFSFDSEQPYIDKIIVYTNDIDYGYSYYLDAIGYTWNSYSINENIIPITDYSNSIQEIDKCEFAYNITNYEPNKLQYNTINNNWNEIDYDNLHVKTGIDVEGEIRIDYLTTTGYQFGIEKEFSYSNTNIFNISLMLNDMSLFLDDKGFNFNISTYDDTLLVNLRIIVESTIIKIYYYDGSSYIYLYSMINDANYLRFNIYIDSFCILRLTEKGQSTNTYYFSKLTNKIGINTIEFIGDELSSSTMSLYVKYIGFYINGSSYLQDDLSSLTINTNISYWNDNNHNIFNILANGSFSFSIAYDGSICAIIFPLTFFNNELKIFYYTESEIFYGNKPYTFVLLSNSTYRINEIKIGGITLKQDINKYFMEFNYVNISTSESYFYIIGNRLYFTFMANQLNDLEGMMATFNINDVISNSRSIAFSSNFIGDSIGAFGLNYSGGELLFLFLPNYQTTRNTVLQQGKTIDTFMILITDNNDNQTYGVSTGYISGIKLIYLPNVEFTMLTTTLIIMIIPLMIILIPTIAIYSKFGKSVVVPMIILMSVICYITNLIPIELFFIIMFGCSMIVIQDYKKDD